MTIGDKLEIGQGKHSFEVRAAGSDAVAKTANGEFAISNNGRLLSFAFGVGRWRRGRLGC